MEPSELNELSFLKLESVYLLATEVLLWEPIEWAHLSRGSHALPFYCPTRGQNPVQKPVFVG